MSAGLYIHIPFCKRKCPYCDFYSVVEDENKIHLYANALITRLSAIADKSLSIDSIYFGGGTPSLMQPCDIQAILTAAYKAFKVEKDCEITLECNPSSTDYAKLCELRQTGVNRLSFGVQSSSDAELVLLGRLHNFVNAKKAVDDAWLAGFDNISCDLMIGTPGQTMESMLASVEDICSLGVTHISCYMLKIEEGTAYDCEEIRRSVADDDTVSDMYLALCSCLESHGYIQYEISNFSKAGKESRHNTKYWTGDEYIGIGPAAHSLYHGRRSYCNATVDEFIANPLVPDACEELNPDRLCEYILLGLRLNRGISLERLESLGGNRDSLISSLKPFEKAGLAVHECDTVRLTRNGFLLSNGIISALIDSQFS